VSSNTLPPPNPPPPYDHVALRDLHRIVDWQDQLAWQPFGDGVEIHRLYGDGINGPSAALLRYSRAGFVPLHEHAGYEHILEHILVLAGAQTDQNGVAPAGTLVVNPPGTRHGIVSESGCIVLAIYEKPVVFLPPEA
jgi:anti-sigma factor ChrR (cupin superfamily)